MGLNFVRLTYWVGGLVDLLAGIQLLLPTSVVLLGFRGLREPGPAGYPAVMAAFLMFGFTLILVWAHLRTVDRRQVLLFTLLVVIALAATNLAFAASGALVWTQVAGSLVIQAVLVAMFATSYAIATREAARRARG